MEVIYQPARNLVDGLLVGHDLFHYPSARRLHHDRVSSNASGRMGWPRHRGLVRHSRWPGLLQPLSCNSWDEGVTASQVWIVFVEQSSWSEPLSDGYGHSALTGNITHLHQNRNGVAGLHSSWHPDIDLHQARDFSRGPAGIHYLGGLPAYSH